MIECSYTNNKKINFVIVYLKLVISSMQRALNRKKVMQVGTTSNKAVKQHVCMLLQKLKVCGVLAGSDFNFSLLLSELLLSTAWPH